MIPALRRCAARLGLAALVLAPLLTLGGCGLSGLSDLADDGRPTVVAAFYPLAWATAQVGGADVRVVDLTQPGVEPHDLALSVRQTAELSAADLVVYEHGFQASVDASVAQNTDHGFDVSRTVRLHRTADGADPHFWQDPLRMAAYVEALGTRLSRIDPPHASAYARRADALVTRLHALDSAYRQGLARCRVHTIVVSHDAFGYLAKYGLSVTGIAGLSPDAEPSAKRIEELQTLVRSDGITTVFSEVLASPQLSEALAGDLGIRTAVLDPLEGVADDAPAGTGYLTIMRSNLAALEKANDC